MRIAALFELGPWATGLSVSLLWIGFCVAAPLAAAFRFARGGSARARYWIALVAFAAAAIVPILAVLPGQPWSGDEEPLLSDRPATGPNPPHTTVGSALAAAGESPLAPLIPMLWLSVSLVLLVREGAGHVILSRRRRHWVAVAEEWRRELAWPDDVPLFCAAEGPSTLGLWKPVVALPLDWLATLPPAAAVCVARHELAHARRRDPLINALVRTVRAALWPAAPLWLLERMIHTEREAAADAAAVGPHDGDRVADYASALVAAAGRRQRGRPRRIAVAFGQGSRLEDRLGRLFGARHMPRLRFVAATAIVAAGALTAAAVPLAPVPSWTPRPMSVAATASPQVRAATGALNEILLSTRFHDHARTPAVKSALARFTAAGTPGPLLEMLQARDARVRECAAWIAGALGDPRAAEGLIAALSDRDPHVRQTAAWALGQIGG
ncbi:MAG TPA: M56 family metallopeptidase [Thermoanaerobaculia bacterium]|jgi:hypothetical protein|nr:M56 family metallopeptidase [Thermoanaerobaculia bacterium]